jgi:hypothetical protein
MVRLYCVGKGIVRLYCVGKGMVRLYIEEEWTTKSYTDILRGHEKRGFGLETISFLTIVTKGGSRRRAMCSVCMRDKDSKNCSKFSYSVHNVCAKAALTDWSSGEQQLQGQS